MNMGLSLSHRQCLYLPDVRSVALHLSVAISLLAFTGCQKGDGGDLSKKSIKKQEAVAAQAQAAKAAAAVQPEPAKAPPKADTEVATGIDLVYLGSRGDLSLHVAAVDENPEEVFSLDDVTTGKALIGATPVTPDQDINTLTLTGRGTTLHLYPAQLAPSGKLAYGTNELRLLIKDTDGSSKHAYLQFMLRDVTLFASQSAAFSGANRQVVGGFQGWLTPLGQNTVTGGQTVLRNGLGEIINH